MSSSDPAASTFDLERSLAEAFRAGLDLSPEEDVTVLAINQHKHWDSLGHISLMAALEERFGVELDDEDVLEIDSYSAAAVLLKARMTAAS